MSVIIETKAKKRLSDVLPTPIGKRNVKLKDVTVDTFFLNRDLPFTSQKGTFVFEITLRPDVNKVFSKKILSYNLCFFNPTTKEKTSDYPISFYEDFENIMGIGETDKEAIIAAVTSPSTIAVSSEVDPENSFTSDSLSVPVSGETVVGDSVTPIDFAVSSASLFDAGIDPDDAAELSMPTFPVSSTGYSLDGNGEETVSDFSLKKSKSFLIPAVGEKVSLNKLRKDMINKSFPSISLQSYALHELSAMQSIGEGFPLGSVDLGTLINISSPYFTSKRTIELDKKFALGGRIYAYFTPVISNSDGDESSSAYIPPDENAETESILIDVTAKMRNFHDPEVPPEIITISDTPGRIDFAIKRNDPTTRKVKVTIRHINKYTMESPDSIPNEEREYAFSGYSDQLKNDRLINCTNKDPYAIHITAQAINLFGEAGVSSSKIINPHPSEHLEDYRSNFVLINCHHLEHGGHLIEIEQRHGAAKKIQLWRENYSVSTSSPLRNKLLKEWLEPKRSEECADKNVIAGRTYRYYVVSEYISNPQINKTVGAPCTESVASSDDEFITALPVTTGLYNVSVEKIGGRSFKPVAETRPSEFKAISEQINNLGISSEFSQESSIKKMNLENLAYFVVERIDRSTGERIFLGIVQSGKVITDQSPNLGAKYTYVFKLCVVSPEPAFILANMTEQAKSSLSTSELNSYVSALSKEITRASGVIDTADTFFSKVDDFKTIKAGLTSKEKTYTIDAIIDPVEIKMMVPTVMREGYRTADPSLKLKWRVDRSDLKNIDTFHVWCEYQGQKTIIQNVNCLDTQTKYTYVDTKYYNEIGEKRYYIVARLKDYVLSNPSNVIIRNKIMPIPPILLQSTNLVLSTGKQVFLKDIISSTVLASSFFEG